MSKQLYTLSFIPYLYLKTALAFGLFHTENVAKLPQNTSKTTENA
jgi:hypothetical protein